MGITFHGLSQTGFSKLPSGQKIEAQFKSLYLYEVIGISSSDSLANSHIQLFRKESDFSCSLGLSINDVCNALVGDDYVENEEEWLVSSGFSPPYFSIFTWLDKAHVCEGGYIREDGYTLITYNCFSEAKKELGRKEKSVVHSLIGNLTSALSTVDRTISFRQISREVFAATKGYRYLRDINFTTNAHLTVSSPLPLNEIEKGMDSALEMTRNISPKIGRFLHLGELEKDTFKKYRYFFLALEVLVHYAFKKASKLDNIRCVPDGLSETLQTNFFDSKNLLDRFFWCCILQWPEVLDSEISTFRKLKTTRDKLAHGEDINEKKLPVHDARQLLFRLMKTSA